MNANQKYQLIKLTKNYMGAKKLLKEFRLTVMPPITDSEREDGKVLMSQLDDAAHALAHYCAGILPYLETD